MYLEKLTLHGFKSFARPATFVFEPGIVAIVGPNGSGKSNVADAIRWVMGEQSMKMLRGKKAADVIFSGSGTLGRKGMAEVSLFLNNEDKQMPVDFSEVVLTRRLFQDGTSEYALNGSVVRLSDVQLLLARSHFGQRTYSVIGQGMIDAVLFASPAERREFFEEAAGVKEFQIKRDRALNKLAATWENLQTAKIQLAEIEPRLRGLTRQVNRLRKRAEVESELRRLLGVYYRGVWGGIHQEHKEEQEKYQEAHKRKEEQERRVRELQVQMGALAKEATHDSRFEKFQREFQDLMQQKSVLQEREFSVKAELSVARRQEGEKNVPRSVVFHLAREMRRVFSLVWALLRDARSVRQWEEFEVWRKKAVSLERERQRVEAALSPYVEAEEERQNKKEEEVARIQKDIADIDSRLDALKERQSEFARLEKKKRANIWRIQNQLQEEQRRLNQRVQEENEARVRIARIETRMEDVRREMREEFGDDVLPPEGENNEEQVDIARVRSEIQRLKGQLEMIGGIDPDIEEEYTETLKRHDFLKEHVGDLEASMRDLEVVLRDLDKQIRQQFLDSFEKINKEFQTFFKQLFGGGHARLAFVREKEEKKDTDVSETEEGSEEIRLLQKYKKKERSGVEIYATPPGKRLKSVHMLSGGERALTSIALICAILASNPSPFVVLDEVDAALDEANSLRFAEILESLSRKAQFIVITHNRATMEKARMLYGVTMGDDGVSQVLSLRLEEAAEHTNR